MTYYAYSPIANKIAVQITGRNTQAIQNRFAKVEDETPSFLEELIFEAAQFSDWGAYWDALNSKRNRDPFDEDMLNTLHFIVGDSW